MRALPPLLVACVVLPTFAQGAPLKFEERVDVIRAVETGSRPMVDQAISRIRHQGSPREVFARIARILQEGDARARQNASYVFAHGAPPAFADVAIRGLSDEDEIVRAHCATALGRMKARSAVKPLCARSADGSPVVRREAVRALGHIGDKSARKSIVPVLQDSNPETRAAAILALGDLKDPAAASALIPLLKDPSETVRLAAARSLSAIGSAEGRKALEALLASEDPGARRDGIKLLESTPAPWATERLFAMTRDRNLEVAITAARTLGMRGDKRGVRWLVLSADRVDAEMAVKIEIALEDLRLAPEERKKIVEAGPTPELALPLPQQRP